MHTLRKAVRGAAVVGAAFAMAVAAPAGAALAQPGNGGGGGEGRDNGGLGNGLDELRTVVCQYTDGVGEGDVLGRGCEPPYGDAFTRPFLLKDNRGPAFICRSGEYVDFATVLGRSCELFSMGGQDDGRDGGPGRDDGQEGGQERAGWGGR